MKHYNTEKSIKTYHKVKQGKIKVIEKPSRNDISEYKKGFAEGFSRGYKKCLENNREIFCS